MRSLAIVPAAGSAERFGGAKLLADVGGRPLIERTIYSLLDGGVASVVVVVGPRKDNLHEFVGSLDPRIHLATNPTPAKGMFSSIQAGLRTDFGEPLVILPGDMPYVHADTVARLLATFENHSAIVSPRYQGKRGHPVLLPLRLRDEILAASPESNLHVVLRAHPDDRTDVDLDDRGVVRDVDVVGDLEG